MAKIFEIDNAIAECFDMETGEILDTEKFESLQMEREAKIESLVMYFKDTLATAKAIAEEIANLKARKESLEKKAESLENYIQFVLNNTAFETPKCKVTFRTSEAVVIAENALIPDEFVVVKETRTPDKKALKTALQNGTEIEGVSIEKKFNPQIK